MSGQRWRACAVLVGLICVLACPIAAYNWALSVLVLPWVAGSASGRRALRKRLRGLAPLLGGLCLSLTLMATMRAHSTRSFWLDHAYPIGGRVLAATLLLCLLTHDLRAVQLEASMRALHLPAPFVSLVMQTSAFGRQLTDTLHAAWAACVLRGGLQSLRALRHCVGAVAGVVVLRSVDRSERVAIASVLRGAGLEQHAQQTHEAHVLEHMPPAISESCGTSGPDAA